MHIIVTRVFTEDIYSKTETLESRTVVVKIMDTSETVGYDIDFSTPLSAVSRE